MAAVEGNEMNIQLSRVGRMDPADAAFIVILRP